MTTSETRTAPIADVDVRSLKKWSIAYYREEWPRIGAVAAMILAGVSVLGGRKSLTNPRTLAVMNALALAVHQYEEYIDPGYFPGQTNAAVMRSKYPRTWPLNRQSSLCINTVLAYPFYLLPIVFPRVKWISLPPMLFGLFQVFDHGVVMPALSRSKYSPGFLAASLLHLPIAVAYIRALRLDGPIGRDTWRKSAGVTALFFAALMVPFFAFMDKDSPYPFSSRHMGDYDSQVASDPVDADQTT
ncbi:HXXEE domain-containing protein [Mycolicibacterium septicum]|uniref:HXXEE domain-containing protein n=1 Tax=Mycolicibacterium septicum TaxID=98668 RepID=UPI0023600CA2|nr:HXXEE domain-containing protein [Mycolicibacterium septicum]